MKPHPFHPLSLSHTSIASKLPLTPSSHIQSSLSPSLRYFTHIHLHVHVHCIYAVHSSLLLCNMYIVDWGLQTHVCVVQSENQESLSHYKLSVQQPLNYFVPTIYTYTVVYPFVCVVQCKCMYMYIHVHIPSACVHKVHGRTCIQATCTKEYEKEMKEPPLPHI